MVVFCVLRGGGQGVRAGASYATTARSPSGMSSVADKVAGCLLRKAQAHWASMTPKASVSVHLCMPQALITEPSVHQPEIEQLMTKACQGGDATRLSPRGAKKCAASCFPVTALGSAALTPTSLSPSGLLPSSTVHLLLIRIVSESFNVPAVYWVLPH